MAAVGGLVRDLLLGRVDARTDLDLVVEGRAAAVAQAAARELGGKTVEHPAFLTATVILPDGRPDRLRDRAAGGLPRSRARCPVVERTSLAEDLATPGLLAERVGHPAGRRGAGPPGRYHGRPGRPPRDGGSGSFTRCRSWRIPRASSARPASPRGWDAGSTPRPAGWRPQAARLDVYRALSGDRLRTELELLLAEPRPGGGAARGRPARARGGSSAHRRPPRSGRRRDASPRRSRPARSPGSLPTPRSACASSPSPRGPQPSRRGWTASRSPPPGASPSAARAATPRG